MFQQAAIVALLGASTALAAVNPANYQVQVGAFGPWSTPDDTPAYSYIDKDGTYYLQSAHALYSKTDSRKWNFFTGENIDSFSAAPIANAVNPANPLDKNADTTWRCNNSPTGKVSTIAVNSTVYAQANYCDLAGVWVDPDTGDWIGLVHNEYTPVPYGDGLHFDAIDRAISHDQGNTWNITDRIITSPYATTRDDNVTFPQSTYFYGAGDPRLIVDVASGYFYVTYGSRIVDKRGGWKAFYSHVARAPIQDKFTPGSWRKFYNGQWNEPGVGGKESNLVPVTASNPNGYTPVDKEYKPTTPGSADQQIAQGLMPSTSPLFVMDVSWNAYLGLWIGEPQAVNQSGHAPQEFYATDDLTTQKWWLIGNTGSYTTASWYRWFLDPASKTTSAIIGRAFRAYCSFGCSGGKSAEYVNLVINGTQAAPPVDLSKTYALVAGGRSLIIDASGKTSSQTGTTLGGWKIASTGDGAFTFTNVATKQALAVSSRAWNTAPVQQAPSNTAVAQQWWIVANRDLSNKPTGSFRVINRYSGLYLSISGAAGRYAETGPGRSWLAPDGGVGGGRWATEQHVTFNAI